MLINEINEPQGHADDSVNVQITEHPNPQMPAPLVPNEPVSEPSSPGGA